MVTITNRWVIVTKDDPSFFPLSMNLTFSNSGVRKVYKTIGGRTKIKEIPYNNTDYLFEIKDNKMYIYRGLYQLLFDNEYFNNSRIIDNQKNNIDINFESIKDNYNEFKFILDGIELRPEQVLALRKMLLIKRCIIQLPTGSGKTEIMCAFVRYFYNEFGYVPTTLIIENNVTLVNGTIERLNKYNIPNSNYRESRVIKKNMVNVGHPSSINNDMNKDNKLLDDVIIILCDECHHARSSQVRSIFENSKNLEYSIGVSASAINQDHVGCQKVTNYDYNELIIMGVTGPLVMNMTSGFLIKKETLASPVLLRMYNPSDEYIPDRELGNWHKVQEVRLYSDRRNEIVVRCSDFFNSVGRKVLILVNTVKWAQKILRLFGDYGLSDITRASYGGGRFEKYDPEYDEFETDDNDVLNMFKEGSIEILIGTTHIYEGTDIPNLDVIILAYGGRKERLQVQGIGRALRKTKNGKYAYIVDFSDNEDTILSRQSKERLIRYREDMCIPEEQIFNEINVSDIKNIFNNLEGDIED